jgi:hypothetical protein
VIGGPHEARTDGADPADDEGSEFWKAADDASRGSRAADHLPRSIRGFDPAQPVESGLRMFEYHGWATLRDSAGCEDDAEDPSRATVDRVNALIEPHRGLFNRTADLRVANGTWHFGSPATTTTATTMSSDSSRKLPQRSWFVRPPVRP